MAANMALLAMSEIMCLTVLCMKLNCAELSLEKEKHILCSIVKTEIWEGRFIGQQWEEHSVKHDNEENIHLVNICKNDFFFFFW